MSTSLSLDSGEDKGELDELTRRLEALEGQMNETPQVESSRATRQEEARGRS